jgi:hypothetical protein
MSGLISCVALAQLLIGYIFELSLHGQPGKPHYSPLVSSWLDHMCRVCAAFLHINNICELSLHRQLGQPINCNQLVSGRA